MENIIRVSVRNLVEFVLRSGDIDNSFMSMTRAVEGTYAHQKVQNPMDQNIDLKFILNLPRYMINILYS